MLAREVELKVLVKNQIMESGTKRQMHILINEFYIQNQET